MSDPVPNMRQLGRVCHALHLRPEPRSVHAVFRNFAKKEALRGPVLFDIDGYERG